MNLIPSRKITTRIVLSLLLLLSSLVLSVAGQCEAEPKFAISDKSIIKSTQFTVDEPSEVNLTVAAKAAGSSWLKKGVEAPVVTIFINGEYNQDVIMFAGENDRAFPYKIALGELGKGRHTLSITLNRDRSAPKIGEVAISSLTFDKVPGNFRSERSPSRQIDFDVIARRHSPFIYARPNTIDKFSDIPLIVYYEIFDEPQGAKRITYSVIFSHEDGGTKGKALMARWGRMTDIEWIYEVKLDSKGNKTSEEFQGPNHVTKAFAGRYAFGEHPLIYNVTDNNNFADAGCSALRTAPAVVRVDLANGSRETLMEKYPWTYRIMSEEIIREGRIGDDPQDADKIFDPRQYLYVEIYAEQKDTAISVELDTIDGRVITSDLGYPQLRVGRNGYFRIAIRNPSNNRIGPVGLRCHPAGPTATRDCENVKLIKVVTLSEDFTPQEVVFGSGPKQIKLGEVQPFIPSAK